MSRVLFWTLFLFLMWLFLTSTLNVQNLLVGAVVSYAIALLYTKMFKEGEVEKFSIMGIARYLYVLGKNLILSNIRINKKILSKERKLHTAIVAVKTDLKSDWRKLLLANSITLTPGTLTLEIKEDTLFIHTLEYVEGADTREITKEFEDAIAKI
jgi:multicomponent Na+:H+ antiporter subunit E